MSLSIGLIYPRCNLGRALSVSPSFGMAVAPRDPAPISHQGAITLCKTNGMVLSRTKDTVKIAHLKSQSSIMGEKQWWRFDNMANAAETRKGVICQIPRK